MLSSRLLLQVAAFGTVCVMCALGSPTRGYTCDQAVNGTTTTDAGMPPSLTFYAF